MRYASDKTIAMFVDLENFAITCLGQGLTISLEPEIKRLSEMGRVVIRRSYGDIRKIYRHNNVRKVLDLEEKIRIMLMRNLIQHEDVPYSSYNSSKNSSDMRLAIDALSVSYENDGIDTIAIISSDRDYIPLVSKLRGRGIEAIGIGSRNNSSDYYINAYDNFLYHENLCQNYKWLDGTIPPQQQVEEIPVAEEVPFDAEEQVEIISNQFLAIEDAYRLIEDGVVTLLAASITPTIFNVLEAVQKLYPDFDPANYGADIGIPGFRMICEQADEVGYIVCKGDEIALPAQKPKPVVTEAPAAGSDGANHLKNWIENKLKAAILPYADRVAIYEQVVEINELGKDGIDCDLSRLNKKVLEGIPKSINTRSCYKVLYALSMANVFIRDAGLHRMNPIILCINLYRSDPADYDLIFIENTMRVYRNENRNSPLVPEVWSEVFYGSKDKAKLIKEIILNL